jgi:hypothetical protein
MSHSRPVSLFPCLLVFAFALAACSPGAIGSPETSVETYLQAIVSTDETAAINASCSDWEAQAVLESGAYQGVDTRLEDLDCSLLAQDGESALVSCSGQIHYSYAGGEDQIDDLGGRVFSAVVQGGEWKMCGLASQPAAEAQPTATQPEVAVADTSTPLPTATSTPDYTPTPDLRPLPADWRNWPIVPVPSPWLAEVYAAGIAAGNDPHHFSVAGDCQNIPNAFMGLYDDPERYAFAEQEEYLTETIAYFAGSFSRDGLAVDGGFNFPAIFTPLRADPTQCDNGEDPLACEIRTWKPSFIIISMEFVYEGRTADNYEQYLRQAVDYALAHHVIPILATKADNVEGGHAINQVTAEVAYEYDIPLFNWWRAAQPLPDHGIDLARDANTVPPNFHITYEAWSVRSYAGLRTLDALRQALIDWGVETE